MGTGENGSNPSGTAIPMARYLTDIGEPPMRERTKHGQRVDASYPAAFQPTQKNIVDMVLAQMREDASYRERILADYQRRWLPEKVRALSTEAIFAKLESLGVPLDAGKFLEQDLRQWGSAELLSQAWWNSYPVQARGFDEDFLFLSALVLWERLAPAILNREMIDDRMQQGYEWLAAEENLQACQVWLGVWDNLQTWLPEEVATVSAADACLRGLQLIFNWCQDLLLELHNAGLCQERFFQQRLRYCRQFGCRFHQETELLPDFWEAEADTHFSLHQPEAGDKAYQRLVASFPDWGWGYISWADQYWLWHSRAKDYAKAEGIYLKALQRPQLQDVDAVYQRLVDFYQEQGDPQAAAKYKRLLLARSSASKPSRGDFETVRGKSNKTAARSGEIGRNDRCPCGSGKKFKRCCGA